MVNDWSGKHLALASDINNRTHYNSKSLRRAKLLKERTEPEHILWCNKRDVENHKKNLQPTITVKYIKGLNTSRLYYWPKRWYYLTENLTDF